MPYGRLRVSPSIRRLCFRKSADQKRSRSSRKESHNSFDALGMASWPLSGLTVCWSAAPRWLNASSVCVCKKRLSCNSPGHARRAQAANATAAISSSRRKRRASRPARLPAHAAPRRTNRRAIIRSGKTPLTLIWPRNSALLLLRVSYASGSNAQCVHVHCARTALLDNSMRA